MSKKENPFTFKSANDATGFLLYQVHNFWHREIKKSLKDLNITHTQFVILASAYWLILHQDEVTQVEIARHAKMDTMMCSNVLRTLEKKNFLKRKEHQTDTRAKLVILTDKGIEILKIAVKRVETFDREFFSNLQNNMEFNKELLRLINKTADKK